jgi:hypothetical protein
MQDGREPDLLKVFHERRRDFPEEPFTCNLVKRIEKLHFHKVIFRRLVFGCGAAVFVIASPALINGSVLLSDALNAIFEKSAILLDKPAGILVSTLCALLLLFLNRRQFSRLM